MKRVFLVLEFMGGRSVASAHIFYSLEDTTRMVFQLLTALAFIHDHDIVHRCVC